MDKKQQFLLLRIEKAGARASLRQGHLISREELLDLRIQIIPLSFRILSGVLAAVSAWACHFYYAAGSGGAAFGFGLLAFLLLLFAIFGFKKTLANLLDGLDAAQLVEAALEGIGHLVGSILDI
jgi:hypothetical protein